MMLSDHPCLGLTEIRPKLMAVAPRGDETRELPVGWEIAIFLASCVTFKGKALV